MQGERVILCPNHPSEDDAALIFGLSCLLGEDFYYLTAHEIFHGHRGWNRYIMPWLGCYSITRGFADISAFKTTRRLLIENQRKLVVFPEGEISHFNELIMPVEPGVVEMAFSAMDKLAKLDPSAEIYMLPVAIKYSYPGNIQKRLQRALVDVERSLGLSATESASMIQRAETAVLALVEKLEKEHNIETATSEAFADRVFLLRAQILSDVALQLGVTVPEEFHQLRLAHVLKSTLSSLFFHKDDATRRFADKTLKRLHRDLMHAIDLIAIEKSCIANPQRQATQDELAEILHLLERVLFKKNRAYGFRLILVQIGEPIPISPHFNQFKADRETATLIVRKTIRLELLSMISGFERVIAARKSTVAAT